MDDGEDYDLERPRARARARAKARSRSRSRPKSRSRSRPKSRSRSRSRARTRSRSPSLSRSRSLSKTPSPSLEDSAESSGTEGEEQLSSPSVVSFCSLHKMKLMPKECAACEAVAKAHVTVQPLVPPLEDFPSADQRFMASRSDEKPPSLALSDSTISLMDKVFTAGRFRIPKHFEARIVFIFA